MEDRTTTIVASVRPSPISVGVCSHGHMDVARGRACSNQQQLLVFRCTEKCWVLARGSGLSDLGGFGLPNHIMMPPLRNRTTIVEGGEGHREQGRGIPAIVAVLDIFTGACYVAPTARRGSTRSTHKHAHARLTSAKPCWHQSTSYRAYIQLVRTTHPYIKNGRTQRANHGEPRFCSERSRLPGKVIVSDSFAASTELCTS